MGLHERRENAHLSIAREAVEPILLNLSPEARLDLEDRVLRISEVVSRQRLNSFPLDEIRKRVDKPSEGEKYGLVTSTRLSLEGYGMERQVAKVFLNGLVDDIARTHARGLLSIKAAQEQIKREHLYRTKGQEGGSFRAPKVTCGFGTYSRRTTLLQRSPRDVRFPRD